MSMAQGILCLHRPRRLRWLVNFETQLDVEEHDLMYMYRVTHHVGPNLLLTPKQRLRFCTLASYQFCSTLSLRPLIHAYSFLWTPKSSGRFWHSFLLLNGILKLNFHNLPYVWRLSKIATKNRANSKVWICSYGPQCKYTRTTRKDKRRETDTSRSLLGRPSHSPWGSTECKSTTTERLRGVRGGLSLLMIGCEIWLDSQ